MIDMIGIQGTKSSIACQNDGTAGKGFGEIKFSDLLCSLDESGKWQNLWKDDPNVDDSSGEALLSRIKDLLSNTGQDNLFDPLLNNLAVLADAESGSSASSEKQLHSPEGLTAFLEELAGILDCVQKKDLADGKEIGEGLLSLIGPADQSATNQREMPPALVALLGESSAAPEVKVAGTQVVWQGGSAAGFQQPGQLAEPPSVMPGVGQQPLAGTFSALIAAAQGGELSDDLNSVSSGEAIPKDDNTALIVEGLDKQVKGEVGGRVDSVAFSERSAVSEVPVSKPTASTAGEFQLKAFAVQESQKGAQTQEKLPLQENKQSEVKSSNSLLINEGLNEGLNTRSVLLQTGSAQQPFAVSRGAPVMENTVLEQVMQAIESSSLTTDKNTHMLSISLKPEYLGELKLVITVEQGIVNAHFLAQNQLTANLIDSQLPDLKQSLSQQGVSWQEVTVTVDTGGTSPHSEQGAEQGKGQQWVENGCFTAGKEDFPEPYSYQGWGMINYVV